MTTIGLILLLAGTIVIFLYMFIHSTSISKNKLIIAFTAIGFAAGNFILHVTLNYITLELFRVSGVARICGKEGQSWKVGHGHSSGLGAAAAR